MLRARWLFSSLSSASLGSTGARPAAEPMKSHQKPWKFFQIVLLTLINASKAPNLLCQEHDVRAFHSQLTSLLLVSHTPFLICNSK